MKILDKTPKFDFMGGRKPAALISALLLLAAVASLALRGLAFGIDFTGGTLIEVGYPQAKPLPEIRALLENDAFPDAQVQYFGSATELLIRIAPRPGEDSAALSNRVLGVLAAEDPGVEMRRVEFVGPQVGKELAEKGGLALLVALGMILIYVSVRFQWQMAVGAVACLIHDVIITLGIFALLQIEFDLTVLAALLAVIGYSLNDTIVVFDRIREGFRKIRKGTAMEIANRSINETLSRTINTGVTTLVVLLALYLLGGSVIAGFSLALIIGLIVGTYSSIYVASALALVLGLSKESLMPVKREEAVDERP